MNTLWRAEWSIIGGIIGTNLAFGLSRPRRRQGEAPGACAVSYGLVRVTPAPRMWSYHAVKGRCEHLPWAPSDGPKWWFWVGAAPGRAYFEQLMLVPVPQPIRSIGPGPLWPIPDLLFSTFFIDLFGHQLLSFWEPDMPSARRGAIRLALIVWQ